MSGCFKKGLPGHPAHKKSKRHSKKEKNSLCYRHSLGCLKHRSKTEVNYRLLLSIYLIILKRGITHWWTKTLVGTWIGFHGSHILKCLNKPWYLYVLFLAALKQCLVTVHVRREIQASYSSNTQNSKGEVSSIPKALMSSKIRTRYTAVAQLKVTSHENCELTA